MGERGWESKRSSWPKSRRVVGRVCAGALTHGSCFVHIHHLGIDEPLHRSRVLLAQGVPQRAHRACGDGLSVVAPLTMLRQSRVDLTEKGGGTGGGRSGAGSARKERMGLYPRCRARLYHPHPPCHTHYNIRARPVCCQEPTIYDTPNRGTNHRLFCRCAPRTRSDRHARGTHPCVHYAPMMITPPPEPAAPHHRASRAHDTATRPERCTSSRPELATALVGEQLGGGARVDRLGILHHLPRLVLEHLGRERDRPVLGVHADHHAPHLVAHRQAVPR